MEGGNTRFTTNIGKKYYPREPAFTDMDSERALRDAEVGSDSATSELMLLDFEDNSVAQILEACNRGTTG